MRKKNENEDNDLLENISKKYCNDNGFTPGIFGEDKATDNLIINYYKFTDTVNALNIVDKIDELKKKYEEITESDSNDDDKILEEIFDLADEYNEIAKESKENYYYYYEVILNLKGNYKYNYYENDCERYYGKLTAGIISLLNNNYINYEKRLIIEMIELNFHFEWNKKLLLEEEIIPMKFNKIIMLIILIKLKI